MYNSNLIESYCNAIRMPDKADNDRTLTYVAWSDLAEKDALVKTIYLRTIGIEEIILPPNLPKGYEMEWHPSWKILIAKIYDKHESASYSNQYLDLVVADEMTLRRLGFPLEHELIDYRLHSEYIKYVVEIEDTWSALKVSVNKLYKKMVDESPVRAGALPCRDKAPSLEVLLEAMLSSVRQQQQ